mmetsp:Transcript_14420/g.33441  ORF Transcript_14420/g.33441 Transcript_14420/m.33441 type:complete len:108 (-) Transcript_14420:370-693(-)
MVPYPNSERSRPFGKSNNDFVSLPKKKQKKERIIGSSTTIEDTGKTKPQSGRKVEAMAESMCIQKWLQPYGSIGTARKFGVSIRLPQHDTCTRMRNHKNWAKLRMID